MMAVLIVLGLISTTVLIIAAVYITCGASEDLASDIRSISETSSGGWWLRLLLRNARLRVINTNGSYSVEVRTRWSFLYHPVVTDCRNADYAVTELNGLARRIDDFLKYTPADRIVCTHKVGSSKK